jgi:hypothetical protein
VKLDETVKRRSSDSSNYNHNKSDLFNTVIITPRKVIGKLAGAVAPSSGSFDIVSFR